MNPTGTHLLTMDKLHVHKPLKMYINFFFFILTGGYALLIFERRGKEKKSGASRWHLYQGSNWETYVCPLMENQT